MSGDFGISFGWRHSNSPETARNQETGAGTCFQYPGRSSWRLTFFGLNSVNSRVANCPSDHFSTIKFNYGTNEAGFLEKMQSRGRAEGMSRKCEGKTREGWRRSVDARRMKVSDEILPMLLVLSDLSIYIDSARKVAPFEFCQQQGSFHSCCRVYDFRSTDFCELWENISVSQNYIASNTWILHFKIVRYGYQYCESGCAPIFECENNFVISVVVYTLFKVSIGKAKRKFMRVTKHDRKTNTLKHRDLSE